MLLKKKLRVELREYNTYYGIENIWYINIRRYMVDIGFILLLKIYMIEVWYINIVRVTFLFYNHC